MRRELDIPFYELTPGQLLALCCYGEARGESHDGQLAQMLVIQNRIKAGGWFLDSQIMTSGLSPCHAVCLKNALVEVKGKAGAIKRIIYQFSAFQEGDPNRGMLLDIARSPAVEKFLHTHDSWSVLNGGVDDLTFGATYYYNPAVCNPPWAKDMIVTAVIGRHRFLKMRT